MGVSRLFVGGLPFKLTEDRLKEVFGEHGGIVSVKIIIDKQTGRSKGYGFVEMDSEDSAGRAKEALNNAEVDGRKITVNDARPPEDRGPSKGPRPPRRF